MLHWISKLHAELIYINIYILYKDFLLTGLQTLSSLNSRNHQPILHEKKKRWSENEVNGKIVTQDFSLRGPVWT